MQKELSDRIATHVLFGRDGIEISLTIEEYQKIAQELTKTEMPRFLMIQSKLLNTNIINGITDVAGYEDMRRVSRGEWQCKQGKWHAKAETVCTHPRQEVIKREEVGEPVSPEVIEKIRSQLKIKTL